MAKDLIMSGGKKRSKREAKKANGVFTGKKQRRLENYDYGTCPVCKNRVKIREQRCFNKGNPALIFFASIVKLL